MRKMLREQIKVISQELGDAEDVHAEAEEYREKMKALPLPEEVVKGLNKEVDRLFKMPPMMAESTVIRNYLDTVLDLPWGKYDKNGFDINKAARILDKTSGGTKTGKNKQGADLMPGRPARCGQDFHGVVDRGSRQP